MIRLGILAFSNLIISDELYPSNMVKFTIMEEIGCMCEKCDWAMKVSLVTAICDTCLKNDHIHENISKF